MKNTTLQFSFLFTVIIFISCKKQDAIVSPPVPETKLSYISFTQDTIPITLSVTIARNESIGSLFTTTIEGQLPDSNVHQNNLTIRVTGDSARAYLNTEIFASYTDSLGITYANAINDTINKVILTKLQNIKQGIVEGNFTIRVSNTTKTQTLLLTQGKFSTSFEE